MSRNTSSIRQMGQVKWFNNKAGYGFITMTGEGGVQTDIFTHYSTVRVQDTQYKFLVQGEYVEFDLVDSTSENHKFQATNVTGMNGGKLMCETRQMNRSSSSSGEGKRVYPVRVKEPEVEPDLQEFQKVQTKRGKKVSSSSR
jgi:cold shock CspA family protein